MPAPDVGQSVLDALTRLTARLEAAEAKNAALEADKAAREAKPAEAPKAKAAWEEVIWVEAMRDCCYPDPGENYQKYRYAGKDGLPGDKFRIAHREHLNPAMRELGKDEDIAPRQAKQVPQTGARGQRVVVQPH